MAALSLKIPNRYSVRCISLPVRSHPSTSKIQEELCKLRTLSSSPNTKTICNSLFGLTELYKCVGDLFKSPEIQHALAQRQHDSLMNELLEDSLRHLDRCGSTKDAILQIKESIFELQSALRRKKGGGFSIESYVDDYLHLRKMIKKEFSKNLDLGKDTEEFSFLSNADNQVCAVVKVLREASLITSFIFNSLLSFLSTSSIKSKNKRWAVVLKLVKKGSEEQAHENNSELEILEAELGKLLSHNIDEETEAGKLQCALTKSEAVQAAIEDLEEGLEGLFRLMIQARVCLLNILSI